MKKLFNKPPDKKTDQEKGGLNSARAEYLKTDTFHQTQINIVDLFTTQETTLDIEQGNIFTRK